MATSTQIQDAKAINTGFKDALLTLGFGVASYIVTYAVTLLPFLDTIQNGRYGWLKIPITALLTALLKGIDRKMHEDSTGSTGIISI